MLTTYDNPFNPFKEFESWWKEDLRLGHDTCGLLGSLAMTSEVFGDDKNSQEIDRAMNEIVERWPTMFKKVLASDFES